ncbi:unnamed protein product [Notodromas monacha]|uniref:Mitochondrial folate transporter/carrier n=1 Tax=Notodromas monacha TaxID=399045 RepID=A0A7R9GEH8_9CRUS|nr:unnamed protein product [Notodromas monacha]CAG0918292.1 unnamed protein product [Notodromas monacha]
MSTKDSMMHGVFGIKSPAHFDRLFAGVSGGIASTLLLHPLDVVKTRFAVDDGRAPASSSPALRPTTTASVVAKNRVNTALAYQNGSSVLATLKLIFRGEGVPGLYRGVMPNVFTSGLGWGLYFYAYDNMKAWLKPPTEGAADKPLSPGQHLAAATWAGVVSLIALNPISVVKTRIIIQKESPTALVSSSARGGATAAVHYTNSLDAFLKIYKFEGLRGLYKGLVPGFCGVIHGSLQFMAYEELKQACNSHNNRPHNCRLSSAEYLCCAAVSKMFAAVLTYPHQVVRARLQDQYKSYDGLADVVRRTFREEGLRGFYKGLAPNLMHVTPNICLVFIIYEKLTEGSRTGR